MDVYARRNRDDLYYETSSVNRCTVKNADPVEKNILWEETMNKYRELYKQGLSIDEIDEIAKKEDSWNRIFIIRQLKKEINNGKK